MPLGSSSLPTALAGQASVHRPHSMQPSRLMRLQRSRSLTVASPMRTVCSTDSMEMGSTAPIGRSGCRLTVAGMTKRWSHRPKGSQAMTPSTSGMWIHQAIW